MGLEMEELVEVVFRVSEKLARGDDGRETSGTGRFCTRGTQRWLAPDMPVTSRQAWTTGLRNPASAVAMRQAAPLPWSNLDCAFAIVFYDEIA